MREILKTCPECQKSFSDVLTFKRPKVYCSQKCYMRMYMRQYYDNHKSYFLERLKEWRKKHPHYSRDKNFLRRFKFLVPPPPICACGNDKYRYDYKREGILIATCMKCGDYRSWIPFPEKGPKKGRWGFCHPHKFKRKFSKLHRYHTIGTKGLYGG